MERNTCTYEQKSFIAIPILTDMLFWFPHIMVVPDLYSDCHIPVYKEILKKPNHLLGCKGTDKLSMGKPYRYLNGKWMYTYEKIWTN